MAAFKSFRARLVNVRNDIKASFQSISVLEKKKIEGSVISSGTDGINLDAGAEILNKFQDYWVKIHEDSEINAKKAEEVDMLVTSIFIYGEDKVLSLEKLRNELQAIPQLVQDMEKLTQTIQSVEESIDRTESTISELEDLIERLELNKAKTDHKYRLAMYEQTKLSDLEKARVKLANQHSEKVKNYEVRQQAILREKQEAFEQAFAEDLDYYKRTGRTERVPSVSSENQADIGDIKVEEDNEIKEVLDEFLAGDSETGDQQIESNDDLDDDAFATAPTVKADEDIASDNEILDKKEKEKVDEASDNEILDKKEKGDEDIASINETLDKKEKEKADEDIASDNEILNKKADDTS